MCGWRKWFTALWGVFAVAFALFVSFAENLIEAINILASIFYGVRARDLPGGVLLPAGGRHRGLLRGGGGAGPRDRDVPARSNIGYLWYNLIGCAACVALSVSLQAVLGPRAASEVGRSA